MKDIISNLLVLFLILTAISCSKRIEITEESNTEDLPKISLDSVNIYIENSASIYGFTTTNSEYINVVTDLASFANIIDETDAIFNYSLISGDNQSLTEYPLGNDASILSSVLSPSGLKKPTSGNSDINGMFNHVLKSLGENSISILISDGIYDIGEESNPLAALETQGIGTRTTFIKNLQEKNTETLVVKLSSDFDGQYYPGVTKSQEMIKQKRPYYIWIFGDESLVDKFFSDDRIQALKGYQNHTAFKKLGLINIEYKNFSFGNSNVKITPRDPKSYEVLKTGLPVVFSIATNLDFLRLGEAYLNNPSNYRVNLGYNFKECIRLDQYPDEDGKVDKALKNIPFSPTHLIFLSSEKPILGPVEISLIPKLPSWIEESTMVSDSPLNGEENRTFGLSTLMNGINEAYLEVSNTKEIFNLIINIKD
ncbi:hypothetical protein SAMN04488104_104419 [Algoriphagus faecimaris]|uniref:Uncharacterized protein n=1 Tax=Algoriphagus faecimaris TaxID=686796 RepID=A0A1G6WJ24_9BACT|nr:hypothetical protein [Algoriphagus faecimaris]SDD65075.1 hypothetical protein SAMN04488104_104419 [Algoriphagus faecimaris]